MLLIFVLVATSDAAHTDQKQTNEPATVITRRTGQNASFICPYHLDHSIITWDFIPENTTTSVTVYNGSVCPQYKQRILVRKLSKNKPMTCRLYFKDGVLPIDAGNYTCMEGNDIRYTVQLIVEHGQPGESLTTNANNKQTDGAGAGTSTLVAVLSIVVVVCLVVIVVLIKRRKSAGRNELPPPPYNNRYEDEYIEIQDDSRAYEIPYEVVTGYEDTSEFDIHRLDSKKNTDSTERYLPMSRSTVNKDSS